MTHSGIETRPPETPNLDFSSAAANVVSCVNNEDVLNLFISNLERWQIGERWKLVLGEMIGSSFDEVFVKYYIYIYIYYMNN